MKRWQDHEIAAFQYPGDILPAPEGRHFLFQTGSLQFFHDRLDRTAATRFTHQQAVHVFQQPLPIQYLQGPDEADVVLFLGDPRHGHRKARGSRQAEAFPEAGDRFRVPETPEVYGVVDDGKLFLRDPVPSPGHLGSKAGVADDPVGPSLVETNALEGRFVCVPDRGDLQWDAMKLRQQHSPEVALAQERVDHVGPVGFHDAGEGGNPFHRAVRDRPGTGYEDLDPAALQHVFVVDHRVVDRDLDLVAFLPGG